MKKTKKILFAMILVIVIVILGFIVARTIISNQLKKGITSEICRDGKDISINASGPQTTLCISTSSTTSEILNSEKIKFKLNMYDENGEKLKYAFMRGPKEGQLNGMIELIFKDSILGMKEYKIPNSAISMIDEDIFQLNLRDFNGYSNVNGGKLLYKIFGKGKIDNVYLQILHGPNIKIEFSILD